MQLPPFGMGCSALGNLYHSVSDSEANEAVQTALNGGVRYFDTAPLYGFGLSERRLGAALSAVGTSDVVVSTKVGRLLQPTKDTQARHGFVDALPFEPVFDYSFEGVMSTHEASLTRLGRSRVNILLAHDLGARTHGTESARMTANFLSGGYEAMRRLRAAGRIDAIGIGVNETTICEELLDQIDLDVILLAGRYTLLEQGALPLLDRCARLGVKVIVGGPFNSGLLVEPAGSPVVHYDYEVASPELIDTVRALRALCAQFDTPLPAAALRFPTAHPAVCCVLPGLANARQVKQTLEWRDQAIPPQLWEALRSASLTAAPAPLPSDGLFERLAQ
jgi:D-threo-aldose 1-dehydrogenase